MFLRGFENMLNKKPEKAELYPYLYSIAFRELGQPKEELKKEPIKCSYCGAILTDKSLVKDDKYTCEYCGTENTVDKAQLIDNILDDIDFILQDIKPKEPKEEEKITGVSASEGELYLSVIDISGSMSGGKIEAVKKSLVQTIKDFKANSPTTKFLLIAFESSVYYYLRHDKDAIRFSGDKLFSLEAMKEGLKDAIKKADFPGSIGEFADGWVRKVEGLRAMDMTALGPALYYAIVSFELFNSTGRITLLTDGLANQGIGNLSGTSPGAQEFYDKMADLCVNNKIVVDVVGVSASGDNNEMGLETLGKITDKTGGMLYLISSEEMEAIFSDLRQTQYIGKDVKVKLIVPPKVKIKNITGAYSSKGAVAEPEINLGAITADRELYVELDSPEDLKDDEEIPVQLQVEYLDNEGRKRMRVVNDRIKVTKNEDAFKASYDQKMNVMMNIQSAGAGYYAGEAKSSKKKLTGLRTSIMSELKCLMSKGSSFKKSDFEESLAYLDDELDEMETEEEQVSQAPAKSFYAAKGQARARMSSGSLKKRMEKKKKQ